MAVNWTNLLQLLADLSKLAPAVQAEAEIIIADIVAVINGGQPAHPDPAVVAAIETIAQHVMNKKP